MTPSGAFLDGYHAGNITLYSAASSQSRKLSALKPDVAILTHFFQTMRAVAIGRCAKVASSSPLTEFLPTPYPANRPLTKETNRGRSKRGSQMFPARQFAASLPVAGAFFAFLFPFSNAQAQDSSGACEEMAEVAVCNVADVALDRRALAHPRRRGKAARRRAFADCA